MGCTGGSAVVVISNQVRHFPPPQYNDINVDLNTYNPKPFQNINEELCEQFTIGPLFNCCSAIYGTEKGKNIFYSTFKDKIKETNKKLMKLTDYEKFIDSDYLQEEIEFSKIKAFLDSNNLDKLQELPQKN